MIPYTETVTTQSYTPPLLNDRVKLAYDKLVDDTIKQLYNPLKPKEEDMCNSTKRWGVYIEPGNRNSDGTEGYFIKFTHKDKSTTDELSRTFETFEKALDFANETHKKLK